MAKEALGPMTCMLCMGLVADAQRRGTAARSRSSTKDVATTAAPGRTTTGLGALRHPTTIEIRNGATAQPADL